MSATSILSAAAMRGRNSLIATLLATAVGAAGAMPAAASDATLEATYYISIAGFTIGRATVEGRFTDTRYTAEIKGSTYGLSRIVSDSRAFLAGSGRISGTRVIPADYTLATSEGGFQTHVNMAMSGGAIVDLQAEPSLTDAPDRVPLTASHKRRVVDPLSAFVVALGKSGPIDAERVCKRTVRVFDGWQRYDLSLSYKETKAVSGGGDAYSGNVTVCAARYVPVAGHRRSGESVQYMADNKRLEVWMAPVKDTAVLVPYRIVIGTQMGDLVISARNFTVTATLQHASAD